MLNYVRKYYKLKKTKICLFSPPHGRTENQVKEIACNVGQLAEPVLEKKNTYFFCYRKRDGLLPTYFKFITPLVCRPVSQGKKCGK